MDLDFIESAKPHSLWQVFIFYGVLTVTLMRKTVLSYQASAYFGMPVANFEAESA